MAETAAEVDTLGASAQVAVATGAPRDLPYPQEEPPSQPVEPRVSVPIDAVPAHGERENGLVARKAAPFGTTRSNSSARMYSTRRSSSSPRTA